MSRGCVNKVVLIGNLGADPEVRFTPSGVQVVSLTLATSESWNDKNGERQERTEWHRLVLWRKLAEIADQFLKKGSKIYVEGKLQTRSWDDQKGQKRYVTEVVVNNLEMLDGAGGASLAELANVGEKVENDRAMVGAGAPAPGDDLPF